MKTKSAFVAFLLIVLFLLFGCVQPDEDNPLKEIKFSEGYAAIGKILENNGTSMQKLLDVNLEFWDLDQEKFNAAMADLNKFKGTLETYVLSDDKFALGDFTDIVVGLAGISAFTPYQEMHANVRFAQETYGGQVVCSDAEFPDYEDYAIAANEIKGRLSELKAKILEFRGEYPKYAEIAALMDISETYADFDKEVTFINGIYNVCKLLREAKKQAG